MRVSGGGELKNQLAIVTGGSGLLGSRVVQDFVARGVSVVSLDVVAGNHDSPMIQHVKCDISSRIEVAAALQNLNTTQEITSIVHCAAIDPKVTSSEGVAAPFELQSLETLNKEFDVSILGGLHVIQESLKHIKDHAQVKRSIVLMGSDLGVISPDQRVYKLEDGTQTFIKPISYSILKHGIVGLAKYLATMLAERNIRVNCVSPGPVLDRQPAQLITELEARIPMGRLATIDEIVGVVEFLTTEKSQYVTGQNIIVDGGRTVW